MEPIVPGAFASGVWVLDLYLFFFEVVEDSSQVSPCDWSGPTAELRRVNSFWRLQLQEIDISLETGALGPDSYLVQ